jgi:adenylosuccinate synthase
MSVVHVVAGAAFGSEGKGHVTAQIVQNPQLKKKAKHVVNIRVAGPNAGHTVLDQGGRAFALRTVPVAAAVDHAATLYIAPGSEIELAVLEREVAELRGAGHPVKKLYVSGEATLLTDDHIGVETALDMHGRIGSTGKGIGAARSERIMRRAERIQDNEDAVARIKALGGAILTASEALLFMATTLEDAGALVVIEGTQGYGLGLHAGHYPTCTSSDTRAIDFLAMAGVMPWAPGVESVEIWLVARVFPIRVAGASGPLKGETTWEELGLPEERTTVTKKIRRVGEWDPQLIRDAVVANGGGSFRQVKSFLPQGFHVSVALTMVDQKIPALYGHDKLTTLDKETQDEFWNLIKDVQDDAGTSVGLVTTAPDKAVVLL